MDVSSHLFWAHSVCVRSSVPGLVVITSEEVGDVDLLVAVAAPIANALARVQLDARRADPSNMMQRAFR